MLLFLDGVKLLITAIFNVEFFDLTNKKNYFKPFKIKKKILLNQNKPMIWKENEVVGFVVFPQ